jgi:toxin ParE1/3/4
MKLVYSPRAVVDLSEIAEYCTTRASPAISQFIQRRFVETLDRICRAPESAPRIAQRSYVREVTIVRYPFHIFYRVRGDTVDILHIRHTSKRPPTIADPK